VRSLRPLQPSLSGRLVAGCATKSIPSSKCATAVPENEVMSHSGCSSWPHANFGSPFGTDSRHGGGGTGGERQLPDLEVRDDESEQLFRWELGIDTVTLSQQRTEQSQVAVVVVSRRRCRRRCSHLGPTCEFKVE
jgi:hypothetical protein